MPQRINFQTAEFLTSAPNLSLCPPETGAEVAFAGRSNAGKSSAINTLTRNNKMARTSKTPGRTQLINFFSLGSPELRLVDLPGYGYAKVPLAVKNKWQQSLSQYLQQRETLTGLVLLMDIRHPLQDFDTMMLNWGTEVQMPVHVLLTKSDKLNRGPRKDTLMKVRKQLQQAGGNDGVTVQTFSAVDGEGLAELETVLTQWLQLPAAEGQPIDATP